MTKMKRLVAWLLVIMMIPVVHGFAETGEEAQDAQETQETQEAQGSPYDAAIKKLCALGMAELDENGQFYPDNEMTRADFTVMAVRVTGFEEMVQFADEEAVFEDVRGDIWYAPYIAYAKERGIVSGDGNNRFYPDETITYTEAIKILVSAMGYKEMAERQGGYPQGYMMIANQQGLGYGVSMQDSEKITRGEAAQICENALDGTVLVETPNSVINNEIEQIELMDYLELQEGRAVVTQSGYASLQTITDYDERKIIFSDGTVCDRNGLDTEEYLGYQVEYIYRQEDGADLPVLLYIEKTSRNEEVEIAAQDIVEVGNNYIAAEDESGRQKNYTFSSSTYILLNGRPVGEFSYELLQPELGFVKMLSNDGSSYNVIFVQSYTNIYVGGIQTTDLIIYDKYDMNKQACLSEEDVDVVRIENADGTEAAFEDIAVGDVISVYASQNDEYVRAVRNTAKIEGSVAGLREEYVSVDGTEYEMTTELLRMIDSPDLELDMPNLGDIITLYLDSYGYIAAFEVGFSTEKLFAYMKSYKYINEAEEYVLMKLFTEEGEHLRLRCADAVLIDGRRVKKPDAIFDRLELMGVKNGLIVYQTNVDGEITYIDTASDGEGETGARLDKTVTGYEYNPNTDSYTASGDMMTYKDKTMSFDLKVLIKGDTPIFQIPSSNIGTAPEDYFVVKTAGDYANDNRLNLDAYQLNPDSYYSDALVVYSNSGASLSVSEDASPVIVKQVYGAVVDGEAMTCVDVVSDSSETTLYPNDETVFTNMKGLGMHNTEGDTYKSLQPGDVIRYRTMPNGRVGAVQVLIGTVGERTGDGSTKKEVACTEDDNIFARMRFAFRYVYGQSDGLIKLSQGSPAAVTSDEFYDLETHKAGSYKMIYVDLDTEEIRKGTVDDIKGWKTNGGQYSAVLVQTRYGDARTMIVIDNWEE